LHKRCLKGHGNETDISLKVTRRVTQSNLDDSPRCGVDFFR
jgi:hypothetical protein